MGKKAIISLAVIGGLGGLGYLYLKKKEDRTHKIQELLASATEVKNAYQEVVQNVHKLAAQSPLATQTAAELENKLAEFQFLIQPHVDRLNAKTQKFVD
ncbi:hypothetical protein [Liquorilactobacillus satsumensis]|uniref:Uncharacterized protein n=1 Tax=Liquorilactobacillus satsumensis DSM 16230 = JCM 12392 TaxID=1423801 RepID=A0A0R1V7C3_9LACO|nr:hypothetical protein [Liquorilactobacillus satsumensis]KRL99818.1 hypothetical protein FD50_GL002353 [Liquorilactobacillus satsumensis DSM 16230 = JCM 12392]MCC7665692.1 hypothetical protein [Liquorilactobacillus satsumensis]MCP9311904.1 hypothetical protein [Liquorilactobacillus satsumensis]MCP9328296.1 hypothetical protein [Liquorilactobacillus satsumensis]MCP9356515.1 hypothetical protein [Liquorilactobacillus satsumensis]